MYAKSNLSKDRRFNDGDVIFAQFNAKCFKNVWYKGVIELKANRRSCRSDYSCVFDDGRSHTLPGIELFYLHEIVESSTKETLIFYENNIILLDDYPIYEITNQLPPPLIIPVVAEGGEELPPMIPEPFQSISLPYIRDIIVQEFSIIRDIPKYCRNDFGRAFNQLLNEVSFHNNILAWTNYFMFVPVILRSFKRGGVSHKKSVISSFARRVDQWMGNNDDTLETKTRNRIRLFNDMKQEKLQHQPANRNKKVKKLVSQGKFSKACQELISDESHAPNDDSTYFSLQQKHPDGQPTPKPENIPRPPQHFSVVDILNAINEFPVDSAAGLSRLRPDHIKASLKSFSSNSILGNLLNLTNLFISGNVCIDVQPYLAGAFLSAFVKPQGGIRPIACGDVARRIAGKILARAVQQEAKSLFYPNQQGVAVKEGCEIIVHSWREIIYQKGNDRNKVGVKIDFSNAFNNVNRFRFLDLVKQHVPQLYGYAWYCYGNPSTLFIRNLNRSISSRQGCQQGCPLANILFCLILKSLLDKMLLDHPDFNNLDLNAWFVDDGSLVGDFPVINKFLNLLLELGPDYGLFINIQKTEIIWLSDYSKESDPFDARFKKRFSPNFDILGAPVGDSEFCNNYVLEKAILATKNIIEKLHDLEDAQVEYTLLRNCVSFSRMNYFLRTTPTDLINLSTKKFDSIIHDAISTIITYNLNNMSIEQIQLNTSNGGLGLRNTNLHHHAAYLSSIKSCSRSIRDIINIELVLNPLQQQETRYNLSQILHPIPLQSDDNINHPQSYYSNQIEIVCLNRLLENSDEVSKARLLAVAMPHASAFLEVIPNSFLGLKLTSNEWNASVAYRLGLQIFLKPFPCPMPSCSQTMDIHAKHAVKCQMAGCRIKRHNDIVKLIFKKCQEAALSPLYEPSNVIRNTNERPADWGLPNYPADGIFSAYDLAITDPTQSKYLKNSAHIAGFAANDYAINIKEANYSNALRNRDDINFVPMIIETFGGWCSNAKDFFRMLSRRLSQREVGTQASIILNYLYKQISVKLQIANARMILKRSIFNSISYK